MGDSVTTVYDMVGRELSVTDAKGNTSTTDYDKLGRAIKAITPFNSNTGGEVKTYYDKNSNTVKTAVKRSNSLYSTTEYKYDVMGNNVAEITENGDSDIVTQYEYDVAGRVMKMITGLTEYSETPAGGAVTQCEYNSSGFVSKVTDPMGGVETYNEYDHAGNVLSVTDRNSNTIRNTYSAYGLKKSRSESSPETKEYTYDGLGHLIKSSSVNKDGETVEETYSYDGLGRLTLSTGNNGDTQSYSYDSNSNLMSYELNGEGENEVSYEYDALNRLTKLTNNGIITTYEYDENGNLLKKEQDNGVSTEYVYNDAGLVTSLMTMKGNDVYTSSTVSYLLNGMISAVNLSGNAKWYNYDLAGRLKEELVNSGIGIPMYANYKYDAYGNRTEKSSYADNGETIDTTVYSYDLNNRLISESLEKTGKNSGYKNTRYYYDGNGNMTAKQSWGSDTASDSETVSSEADVTGYAEDSGTAVYRYDAFGRLTDYNTTSMAVSYKYNADNLRTQKTVNGPETRYVWNGENLAGEYGGSSGIYTYDGQGIHISNKDGVIKTYLKDQHGSIVGYADEDGELIDTGDYGMDYDAFGNQWTGDAPNPFGYSGEYHDSETGLIYLRNRYYDSSTGRFITEDPAKDGVNWYSYCGGDPVNMVDPWGLWMEGDENLSEGAQAYTMYYGQQWQTAKTEYDACLASGDLAGASVAQSKMDMYHDKAEDIRAQDAAGTVQGKVLNVPLYNQLGVGYTGTNLCWAAGDAMWISYLLGDTTNRTINIASAVANDMVAQGIESLNSDGTLNYNVPRSWQSTDYVANLLGISGIGAVQTQNPGILSMKDIQSTIDNGNLFAALYRNSTSGHWVLGIGYATALGHDPLVVSNDPWNGDRNIQTYDEFKKMGNGRIWSYTAM